MSLTLDLQIASESKQYPEQKLIESWITAALTYMNISKQTTITLRIVDETEIQELNKNYRDKNKHTNVLAFPSMLPEILNTDNHLGDILACAPVIEKEALEQHKNLTAHWAHMVVHSTLHLLGYDHQIESQAHHMEHCEQEILKILGFPNPYLSDFNPNFNSDNEEQ